MKEFRESLRATWKLLGFAFVCAAAVVDFAVRRCGRDRVTRGLWLQRWAKAFLLLLGIKVEVTGEIPLQGLVVGNHTGYLDVVLLGSAVPCRFVSKSEVADWPAIGLLTRLAGTIFIRRSVRSDVGGVGACVEAALRDGSAVVVFPEGTSSGGNDVLPFRTSLLEPAIRAGVDVTPVAIAYALPEGQGSAADEVCYWGDMIFFPHLLNLMRKEVVFASVSFGSSRPPGACRKELGNALRGSVAELLAHRRSAPDPLQTPHADMQPGTETDDGERRLRLRG